jgi:hypothetical protein
MLMPFKEDDREPVVPRSEGHTPPVLLLLPVLPLLVLPLLPLLPLLLVLPLLPLLLVLPLPPAPLPLPGTGPLGIGFPPTTPPPSEQS